ncbi:MAG: CRTAC1 family protein [Acidobacteria bacterium]|nr:MAG: CRTAC1 family protein [Acidobacteriota bacterium]
MKRLTCIGTLMAFIVPLAAQVRFVDITRQTGINFVHNNGAYGKKYLPETMGAGCAFLDYDNDGWLDIFLVNGSDWPERKKKTSYPSLYRNNRNGTFTEVTRTAGLAVEMYGMGCAVADYDNDGDQDIYVTALGPDRLFQNLGNGKFKDTTTAAGLGNREYGSSAAWLDYDRDGLLDLFVANYVKWTRETDIFCTLDGKTKSYCTPESYKGVSSRLYRNVGQGRFKDVTQPAKLFDESNKGLGVLVFDYNWDGWPDILQANDTEPNRLWENNRNGTFTEVGVMAGVAFSEDGVARGAMGIDAADYDGSGHLSVVIGNFSNQMLALYHNEGTGFFIDEAPRSALGPASLLTLAFGCFFFDYNLDGRPDIYVANGHVENDINHVQKRVTYAQSPHLFENQGRGRFSHVTERMGKEFTAPRVGRGAAYGDIDNDGDLDVLLTTSGGPAALFRNEGGNRNNWVAFDLKGQTSNRDGIGAVVRVKSGTSRQVQMVKSGGSYCSQSQLRLTFGLGQSDRVDEVEILWPSGRKQVLRNLPAKQVVRVEEKAARGKTDKLTD